MTSFELDMARNLVERAGERLEGVLEDLQAMSIEERAPADGRYRLAQIIYDLKSVAKFLQAHKPAPEGADNVG